MLEELDVQNKIQSFRGRALTLNTIERCKHRRWVVDARMSCMFLNLLVLSSIKGGRLSSLNSYSSVPYASRLSLVILGPRGVNAC